MLFYACAAFSIKFSTTSPYKPSRFDIRIEAKVNEITNTLNK